MLWLSAALCACERQHKVEQTKAAAPTKREAEILNLVLANMNEEKWACLQATTSTTDWYKPDWLSFAGEREHTRAGNTRFDQIARIWDRPQSDRQMPIRVPGQASRLGFRVIEDANPMPSCRERLTLYTPIFEGDFAVVAADVQFAGNAGGNTETRVFRFRKSRWESVAFGTTGWGRPII